MSEPAADLTARFAAAMLEPELVLEVGSGWVLDQGVVPTVRRRVSLVGISRPGATTRSKPVALGVPTLYGDHGQTAADLLEAIAGMMRQSGRKL